MRTDLRYLSFLVGVTVASFLAGCGPIAGSWQFRETGRIKSPDGQVEAVVVTGDAGATTSKATLVVIVPSGGLVNTKSLKQSDAVFWADHLKEFNVVWKQSKLLCIEYDEARIAQFRNLWDIWEGRNDSYAVEIRLCPTRSDFSVPLQDRVPRPVH
jgi:hypothetical protein